MFLMTIISLADYLTGLDVRGLVRDRQERAEEPEELASVLETCPTCDTPLIYICFNQLRVPYCSKCRVRK